MKLSRTNRTPFFARLVAVFALVFLSFGLVAASCGQEKEGGSAQSQEPTTDKKDDGKKGDGKKDDVGAASKPKPSAGGGAEIPTDIYPGFNLQVLTPEERARFVGLAKAELCPCPDSTVSMDQCLRKEETQCGTVKYSAMILAGGIKEGQKDTDILDQIAKYIEAIKKTHEFSLADLPHMGNPEAKVVLVEFADFQCPHCKLASEVMAKVAKKYDDKIAFYYKHYPLPFHPQAEKAAVASYAAHKQGKFWPMHDLIFANQDSLSPAKLKSFAQQLGLNMDKFEKDIENPEILQMVATDKAEGEKAGIDGTPALFVNGKRYMGDKSVEEVSKYIDNLLEEANKKGGEEKK